MDGFNGIVDIIREEGQKTMKDKLVRSFKICEKETPLRLNAIIHFAMLLFLFDGRTNGH